MSKYDNLDARRELEQEIKKDLVKALEKRGFNVKHNGTVETHAPAGKPDIEVWNNNVHINVEITRCTKSSQDHEWQSIKDHFEETKRNHPTKNCFLWFVSPETYYRIINSIKDWNFAHKNDPDQKFLPICFSTLELFYNKLAESPKEQYTAQQIISLFDDFVQFIDDESILRHFFERLFSHDQVLKEKLESKEEERHQRVVEELVAGFIKLEQKLREEMVATKGDAIKNVIYLVFIKLYEEKKEKEEQQRNRFTSTSFPEYQVNVRDSDTAIHKLFNNIKNDEELKDCKLLTDDDRLSDRLKDDFVLKYFITPFEEYAFYTAKVDGLGAAYEVLGKLSGKDVTVGQFFTLENVVKFMVKLADLHESDVVFDPACGTARFLTNSMQEMIEKVKGSRDEEEKITNIQKQQLFGTDDDPTVAKLAKMNMYIHGDGKTNILDQDGLTQFDKDEKVDVILTNPPLGDLSYWRSIYTDDFRLKRMETIPKNNLTKERLDALDKKIEENQQKLASATMTLAQSKRLQKTLTRSLAEKHELEYKINHDESEYITSGSKMKGGALFLAACKYYLKPIRDRNQLPEWRGGKILTILDEGVLNTANYTEVRNFIKKYFFIKAVISLTRDTFVPVSSTSTKTSILYAIKKDDISVKQQEPIFFAHAEKVGIDTRKKTCKNDLFNNGSDVLSKYKQFKESVMQSYDGVYFNKEKFLAQGFKKGELE